MIIEVQGSANEPYKVDTEALTCTCPQYRYRCSHYPMTNDQHFCKHMEQVFQEHPEYAPAWLQKKYTDQDAEDEVKSIQDPDGKTRYSRVFFDSYVSEIKSVLKRFNGILKFEFCGSYRRLALRCSDLDVLIMISNDFDVNTLFDYLENVMEYSLIQNIGRGNLKAAYMIDGIIHVDFKVISEEAWPFATIHFTGSKAHNIKLRQRAISLGYSLSEYGLRTADGNINTFGCKTEEDVFKILRVPYVEPWNRG